MGWAEASVKRKEVGRGSGKMDKGINHWILDLAGWAALAAD